MNALTLEEKIGQMLLAGFEGLYPPDYILEWLAQGRIGGVILFARNVASPKQLSELTSAVHRAARHPALVAIDQEGGTVARLRQPQGFTESPGAMALSAAENSEILTQRISHVLGTEMRVIGINWTFAPAVDISYNPDNPTVGTRSFGSDKEQVSQLALAAVTGFQSAGVAACAKHFPGLGDTAVDTHLALPVLDTPLEHLIYHDLMPYRAVIEANVATIMTTHTVFSKLDSQYPATLSPVVVKRLLREELRFEGVVCSDCMEMKAISDHYPPQESAVLAALAGIDAILYSHTRAMQEAAYEGLLAAAVSGRVPLEVIDTAVARMMRLKAAYPAVPGSVEQIGSETHMARSQEAARAAVTLMGDYGSLLPLQSGAAVVEFASYMDTEVMEQGGLTGFGTLFHTRFPEIPLIALNALKNPAETLQEAFKRAKEAETLILATRNAHLIPEELELARQLLGVANRKILVCLRNPYDAGVLDNADVTICTCGDSTPSLQAVVDALAGDYVPAGRLPVLLD